MVAAFHLGGVHSLVSPFNHIRHGFDCADTHNDPRVDRAACERMGIRSMLVVPLLHQERCMGVLKAMSREPESFGRAERTLLSPSMGLAILLMELNGVDTVEGNYGTQASEQLVQSCAGRLVTAVAERGLVARLGPTRFGVLLPALADASELTALQAGIIAAMESPVSYGWVPLPLSIRLASACYETDDIQADSLLTAAEIALEKKL
ncbi:MAG: diguanylate cyclase [Cyanobium sp. CZS 25K]|nr:diguanylate cyclase [Cyanobium sp. CZS25K]